MSDPLSPASLAAVPEVREALRLLAKEVKRTGTAEDEMAAEENLLLAVRDAVLSAERERLLALTPEAVVEEAAQLFAIHFDMTPWDSLSAEERQEYRDTARAALPVLVAPEVAKREQVEKDLREELGEHADSIREWEKETEKRIAAESRLAEVARELSLVLQSPNEHLRAAADLATRLGAAEAEVARLKGELDKALDDCRAFAKEADEMERQLREARAALGGANG